jgi:hypothetical protein
MNKLTKKFQPANKTRLFMNVKTEMANAKYKYERAAIYSKYYKQLPIHERKVFAHFRDTGVWYARNHFKKASPSVVKPPIKRKPKSAPPVVSPRSQRRQNVEAKFDEYWKKLNKNNRNTVRNYIARHKSPAPVVNRATQGRYSNALKNINALKTAKARAEWLKAKKLNFSKNDFAGLKEYVSGKNQANRNRRAAKKAKAT